MRTLSVFFQAFISFFFILLPSVLAGQVPEEQENAPYFLVESEQDGVLVSMPLVATSAQVDISGLIADVKISQRKSKNDNQPWRRINLVVHGNQWPSREELTEALQAKYPTAEVDWTAALGRNRYSEGDAPLLYQFNVPVDWLDVYAPDSVLPEPRGQRALRAHAGAVNRLATELHRLGLNVDDFAWRAEPSAYTTATGQAYPALALHGQTRVFCILQPLADSPDPANYTRLRYTTDAR